MFVNRLLQRTHNHLFTITNSNIHSRTKKYVNYHRLYRDNTILKFEIDKLKLKVENMDERVLSLQRTRTYGIIYISTYIILKIFW